MTYLNNIDLNDQEQRNFAVVIDKYPDMSFKLVDTTLPSISLDKNDGKSPYGAYKQPNGKLNYSDFVCTFRLDMNLKNYKFFHDWMIRAKQFNPYTNPKLTIGMDNMRQVDIYKDAGITSNIIFSLLDDNGKLMANFTMVDCWPTNIGALSFTYRGGTINFVPFDVTFSLDYFTVKGE